MTDPTPSPNQHQDSENTALKSPQHNLEFAREREYLRTNGTQLGAYKFLSWQDVEQRLGLWKQSVAGAELMYNVTAESDPLLLLRLRDKGVVFSVASASHLELLSILEVPQSQIRLVAGASSKNTTEHAAEVRPAILTVGGIRALEDLCARGCIPTADWQPTLQILVKCAPNEPLANPSKIGGILNRAQELGFKKFGISVVLSDSDSTAVSFNRASIAVNTAAESFRKVGCTIDSVHLLGGLTDSESLSTQGISLEEYLAQVSALQTRLSDTIRALQPSHAVSFSIEAGQVLVGHVPLLSVITNVKSNPSSDALEAFFVSTVYGDLAGHMYNKSDISIRVLPPPEQDTPLTGAAVNIVLHDGCCDSVGSVWEISDPPRWKRFQVPSDIRGGCLLAFYGKHLDNGKTDFNMIPPAAFVLIDENDPNGPFFDSPWKDYHAPFFDAAKRFIESPDGQKVKQVVQDAIAKLDTPGKAGAPRIDPNSYYREGQDRRRVRASEAAKEWLSRNSSTTDTLSLVDLQEYAKALRDVNRYLREMCFQQTDQGFMLAHSARPTVDSIKIPIKTFCDPIALIAHAGAGLDHDAASAGEMLISKLVGGSPTSTIVSHPHKTPDTLSLMLDPEFQPGATTIDSKEELDRLIQAGLPRDVVLYVRVKARGKDVGTDLSLKFGARYSQSQGIDDVTPLLRLAHEAGFTKLGVAFHVGTQCYDPGSYGASLRHCLAIAKAMFRSTPSIKVTHFNIGGGFSDERVAMRNNTGGRQVLALVSAEVGRFRDAVEKVVGEPVYIIAEPGRVTCALAGTLLSRVIEDHASESTEMRVRIAMTQQGGLSGNVHDGQYFATEPLYKKETDTNISVLVVGSSNRPGETFPSVHPDRKHILPLGIKTGDWLMFPEAGAAYGWNASGAADGIDPGVLIAFYTDEDGQYHFIESPWSNREALRNSEVRRWYHSRQH